MSNKTEFTFGTDPEFVVMQDGKAVSAIPIVNGTKDKKRKSGKCFFFYDNVLAECTIPYASSKAEAVENIGDCLKRYAKIVHPYKLATIASHVFPKDQLQHPEALKINCHKENCAYAMEEEDGDEFLFQKTDLRSAGGHIHLGCPEIHEMFNPVLTIRMMDLFVGIPSIFIDHDPTSKRRRELYGKAGRYRLTPYGVEYRSIGNFWLSSPKLVELVYDLSELVVKLICDKTVEKDFWTIDYDRVMSREAWADHNFHISQCHTCHGYDIESLRSAINTSDKGKGEEFLKIIGKYSSTLLGRIIEESQPHQYNLYKEWNINDR